MARGILNMLKLFLAILLVPALVALTESFATRLDALKECHSFFVWGILTYIIMHFFIFVPQKVYQTLQTVFAEIFQFSSVLATLLPLIIPVLATMVLLFLYTINSLAPENAAFINSMMFLAGLTLTMHIVLTARTLYDEDANFLKGHYFLVMILTYICNILIIAALMNLNFDDFNFADFFKRFVEIAKRVYVFYYQKI